MTSIEEMCKLLAVKIAFEAIAEKFKQEVKEMADDIGADITLNVEIKVNSVNLEQCDETLEAFRKKFANKFN